MNGVAWGGVGWDGVGWGGVGWGAVRCGGLGCGVGRDIGQDGVGSEGDEGMRGGGVEERREGCVRGGGCEGGGGEIGREEGGNLTALPSSPTRTR